MDITETIGQYLILTCDIRNLKDAGQVIWRRKGLKVLKDSMVSM